jgi:hypothetical protein
VDTSLIIQLGYVVASALFIFGLKLLGSPATARKGNKYRPWACWWPSLRRSWIRALSITP